MLGVRQAFFWIQVSPTSTRLGATQDFPNLTLRRQR